MVAAIGAITGSVIDLAQPSIVDVATAAIGLVSLAVPLHFKLDEPLVVIAGLALWPLVQGGV